MSGVAAYLVFVHALFQCREVCGLAVVIVGECLFEEEHFSVKEF
jgi:hypothetical protein